MKTIFNTMKIKDGQTYYTVIKRDQNSWSATTGRGVTLAECPHRHRSEDAAEACRQRLLGYDPKSQMWSAKWHGSRVEYHRAGLPVALPATDPMMVPCVRCGASMDSRETLRGICDPCLDAQMSRERTND